MREARRWKVLLVGALAAATLAACTATAKTRLTGEQRELARGLYRSARKAADAGELYGALRGVMNSLAINPDDPEVHELNQEILLKLEDSGDRPAGTVEQMYRKTLRDHPDDPAFIYLYGRALYHTGRPEEGFQRYQQALQLDGAQGCPQVRSAIARYWSEVKKDETEARRFARQALIIAEKNRLAAAIEADVRNVELHAQYQDLAKADVEPGSGDALEDRYKTLLKRHPSDEVFEYLCGRVIAKRSRLEEARPYFERALQRKPDFPWALDAMGVMALEVVQNGSNGTEADEEVRKKASAAAESYFRRAIGADPNFIKGRIDLSTLLLVRYGTQNDSEALAEAARLLEEAIGPATTRVDLLILRGKVCLAAGAPYLAAADFGSAADKAPAWDDDLRAEANDMIEAISKIGAERLPRPVMFARAEYMRRMGSADPAVRRAALEGCTELPDRLALTEALTQSMQDPDPTVRTGAIEVMDRMEMYFPQAAVVLGDRLVKDTSYVVRGRAAAMLGNFKDKGICGLLIRGLADENAYVREVSFEAIRRVSGETIEFKFDGSPEERAAGLGRWMAWWERRRSEPAPAPDE